MADIDRRIRGGKVSYRVRYRDPAGRQREKTFAKRADAARWATENAHAAQVGSWVDPVGGKVLLGAFAERWYAAAAPIRRPATRRGPTASSLTTRCCRRLPTCRWPRSTPSWSASGSPGWSSPGYR